MILYCIDNPAFLGNIVLHKYAYSSDETTVLMVDEKMYTTRKMMNAITNMKNKKVFDDIIITNMFCDTHLSYDQKNYEQYVIGFYDNVFRLSGYKTQDFERIYCMNDLWDGMINLYFNLIKREYIWLACSVTLYTESMIDGSKEFQVLSDKYNFLNPFAPYAKVELQSACSEEVKSQIQKGYTEWDKSFAIDSLSKDDLKTVIQCFGVNTVTDGSWVLVLNSYGAIRYTGDYSYHVQKIMGFRDYPYAEFFSTMNNTALDYYVPEDAMIYVKAHPNDPISDEELKKIYGKGVKNLSTAPYELLEKYLKHCNVKFKGIIGFDSTITQFVKDDLYENSCILGESFHRTWFFYDSLYVISKFAEYVQKDIYTIIDLKEQMVKLAEARGKQICIQDMEYEEVGGNIRDSLIIIDCIDMGKKGIATQEIISKADKSNILCFLNADLAEIFFDDQYRRMFVPVCIKKKQCDSNKINLCRDEFIWIYSEDIKIRRKIYDFTARKYLSRQGVEISVQKISPAEGGRLFEYYSLLNFKKKYLENLKSDR